MDFNRHFNFRDSIVAIVVLCIVAAVAIPHYIAKKNYEKINYDVNFLEIKVNDYHRQYGVYPNSVDDLVKYKYLDARGLENPYQDIWQLPVNGQPVSLGQLGYELVNSNGMTYRISAVVPTGQIIRIGK